MRSKTLQRFLQVVTHPLAVPAAFVAASNYAAAALGFVTAAISARLLGPGDYGLAALAIAYPSLIWSLAAMKSEVMSIRYLSQFRAAGEKTMIQRICKFGYLIDLISSLIALAVVAITSGWVAERIYRQPDLAPFMTAYALSLPFRALGSTSTAIFSTWEHFHWTAIGHFLERLSTLLCVTGLIWGGFGIGGFVIGTATVQAITGVALAFGANGILARHGFLRWWKASVKELSNLRKEIQGLLGWTYLTTTLVGLAEQIPIMLLGRIRGPDEAGFFRLASSLITAATYMEGALSRVTYPRLSTRWMAGDIHGLRDSLLRWTTLVGVPTAFCLLATIPLLPWAVALVFTPKYLPMIAGTQIMIGGVVFGALFFWLSSAYYAFGRARSWAQGYLVYTVVLLGLSWPAITGWGFLGMAVVTAAMKLLFCVGMAWLILTSQRLAHETVSTARAGHD